MNEADVPKANVCERRCVSTTEYLITGDLDAVTEKVKSIFVNFDSRGYGTYLHQMERLSDGSYGARMSRLNSCD